MRQRMMVWRMKMNAKQVAWLEDRIAQRDAKLTLIYGELRQEQSAHLGRYS